jgi:putative transposase
MEYLTNRKVLPGWTPEKFIKYCKYYSMKDDTLYYKDRKVVKQNESDGILWIYHNNALAGHFGVNKTLQNIRQHYY